MRTRELIQILVLVAAVGPIVGCGRTNQKVTPIASGKAAGGFTADLVVTAPGTLTPTNNAKIYSDGVYKLRLDGDMYDQLIIKDKGRKCLIFNDRKAVVENDVSPERLGGLFPTDIDVSKLKKLGKETVDGYVCTKYTDTTGSGAQVAWIADDLNLLIRIESRFSNGVIVQQMKNIKLGKPAPSVFEVPKGYRHASMEEVAGEYMRDLEKTLNQGPGGKGAADKDTQPKTSIGK